MKYIGAHVSAAGGVENAPVNANKISARGFALFTKNQRQWKAKPLTEKSIEAFKERCRRFGFDPKKVLAHDSYLINLGHPDEDAWKKSNHAFIEELKRCRQLGIGMLNFHPGSTLKKISEDRCVERIANGLNLAHEAVPEVITVVENTAGQGSNMGYTFEQIRAIIDGVNDPSRMGVCIDTCHAFAAGYDFSSARGYEDTWSHFDVVIGFSFLKGMHLNDSKKGLGSRVDRHASIGKGEIGLDAFQRIMEDTRLDNIPMILETPDNAIWAEEIALLKGFVR